MEKFPKAFKKVGKVTKQVAFWGPFVLAGVLAGKIAGEELKKPQYQKKDLDNISENKTENKKESQNEWNRNDLESNEEINKKVTRAFAIEELKQEFVFWQEVLDDINKENLEYRQELEYRKINNKPFSFKDISTEHIIEEIKRNEDNKSFIMDGLKSTAKELKVSEEILTQLEKTKLEEIKRIIYLYDIGRQWVLNNIEDPKYQERLEKEFSDEDKTNGDLASFIKNNYENRTKEAFDKNFILSKDVAESYKSTEGEEAYLGVEAFYNPRDKKTYFPLENDSIQAVMLALHEYAHKVTEANRNLSPKAIKLFSEAFDTLSVAANFKIKNNQDSLEIFNYFSDPTEMYVRKKVFEYDLERLGVKKYGELFTKEHLLKAAVLRRNGKLSNDSQEFLIIIRPEMLIKVMNEIADIDENEKKDLNSA
jgi:hypothetical protein